MRDIRERVRAAGAYLDGHYPNDCEMRERNAAFAFLTIFHPELSLTKRLRLATEMAKKEE